MSDDPRARDKFRAFVGDKHALRRAFWRGDYKPCERYILAPVSARQVGYIDDEAPFPLPVNEEP